MLIKVGISLYEVELDIFSCFNVILGFEQVKKLPYVKQK